MQNKNLESRIQNVECKIKPKDKILKSLNPKFYQLNSTKKAFTLVELIVTIVLLAILTTISFLSFQGFSKSSRDSVRISDIDNIEKNLWLFIVNTWYYPTPDNPTSITYKWWLAWVQWTIWDNVTKNIENINKKPIDPLTNSEYAYSITNNKREYQIWTIIEEASTAYIKENLFTQKTYALWTKKVIAKIKWTYNEKIIKVSTWWVSYVLAIPSIITSNLNNTDIESIISNKELVYNDYSNVPDSYKTSWYTMTWWFEFSPQEIVAYSWSSIDFTNNENKIEFVTNLQKIYSWTVVEWTNTYDEIMKIDTIGEPDKAVNLINNYIVNNVWWISWKITTVFFNSCTLDWQTINHNQQVTAYSENNISYGSSYSCIDRAQTRTCVDWVLSWSEDYKYSNCIKGEPTNCEASWSYLYYSHTYSIPLINHAEILTGVLSTWVSENNWIYSYILSSIECNDWNLINPIEEENPTVISCNTWYTISWNSCVTATYTISWDFWTNASWATVDVCWSDVIADENWIFSTIRNYWSTCDTISALRTWYTCSTTTQWPTILTENISNILWLCSINSYTVSFDWNGWTWHTPTSKSVTYNSSIWTLPTNPTKDGYTFNWWYTQSTWWSQITESTTVLWDATVYAQWNVNNYTITFDWNGWTWHTPTNKSVTYNTAIWTLPSTPTMTWYTFNWWYTLASGWTQINTWTIVLWDATVYAQWNINNYTITFDWNGWTWHTPTNKSVIYNTAIWTLPSTPTMTWYTFNWWYTSASGWTQINTWTIVLWDATVYAQWNINNYTITFDWNGWTWHTPTNKSVIYNTEIWTLPSTPTMTWYAFNWWYTSASGWTQINTWTIVTWDATVYAQWNINNYTVTFDWNWWTWHTPTSKLVTYNTAIWTLPSNPTRTGYTFNWWYTAISWWTQVTINTVVLWDATLYAQWTINDYIVTFDWNWWTWHTPTSKSVTYNTAIWTLPSNPTRTGYTFAWWYTASSWWTQVTINTVVLWDATLYAQWIQDWVCWTANWTATTTAPSANLCSVWTASLVTTNTWNFTWTCSVAWANTGSCSATRQYTITFNSNSWSTASPTSKVVNYNTAIWT